MKLNLTEVDVVREVECTECDKNGKRRDPDNWAERKRVVCWNCDGGKTLYGVPSNHGKASALYLFPVTV